MNGSYFDEDNELTIKVSLLQSRFFTERPPMISHLKPCHPELVLDCLLNGVYSVNCSALF